MRPMKSSLGDLADAGSATPGTRRPPGEARAQLIESAHAAFREQGFRNTSTREIAERAHVAEGLIFRYFGSKRELFREAIVDPFGEEILGYMAEGRAPWVNFNTGLFELLHRRRPELIAILTADEFDDGVVDLASDNAVTRLAETMEVLMRKGAADYGWVGVDTFVQSRVIVATILGLCTFDRWLFDDATERPDTGRLTREMLLLFERGLASHAPRGSTSA